MKNSILAFFALLSIISCKNEPQFLIKIEGKQVPVNNEIVSDSSIVKFIQPYKEKVEAEMNTEISYTKKDLTRLDGELESSLGNLMADMCYIKSNPVFNSRTGKNIDFSMFNYGGIRAGITKGPITNQHAFKLMPFENSLVVVEITGSKMEELIQYLIDQNKAHPLSKQVKLSLSKDSYTFTLNDKPFDNSKNYFVLTSDYLQHGGDNMKFFDTPVNLYKLDYKVRNAIIDYFKDTDTVNPVLDSRFTRKN